MRETLRPVSYSLALLIFALAVAPASMNLVSASDCSIQLGYPIIPTIPANQSVTVIVPLSATCSTAHGQQLYASASAVDLSTGTSASAVNTIVTSVDGGYTFTGQLGFNLPPSTEGHWVQVAVTVYQSQAGGPITTTGEAFPITAGTVQVVTATVTQQTPYQFAPAPTNQPPQPHYFIFAYVAIAAILATVIIVTVALIVYSYSRRPVGYYTVPRPY